MPSARGLDRAVGLEGGEVGVGAAMLREQVVGLDRAALIRTLARLRPVDDLSRLLTATRASLRRLAAATRPWTRRSTSSTPRSARWSSRPQPQLLAWAGDNPERMRSEAAFAHLAGVAPITASFGRTHRHRLNRGGDRAANNALHTIVLARMRFDERTRAYAERHTTEGLS